MTKMQRNAVVWILLSGGVSILWGLFAARAGNEWVDFRAIYFGSRCLIDHQNPYNVSELESVYRTEGGARPAESAQVHQAVTLFVNVPTTLLLAAPLAILPLKSAEVVWIAITVGVYLLAAWLIWDIGARFAPTIALWLVCIVLINSEAIFCTGNTAGIVVSLTVVAVWCSLMERFTPAGILAMALSLAIKPHDAGLVWLFLLLMGGIYRKRALQSLVITSVIGLSAILWIALIAPHWLQDWQGNLAAISAHGGINEPGPASVTAHSSAMVIDLQAAIAIFHNDPRVYNFLSYLICGGMLLAAAVQILRKQFSPRSAWLALAAVSALTMLVTYHKPWDAKLLLLTIPACAMLATEGKKIQWMALLVTASGLIFTGDIPLGILTVIADHQHLGTTSFLEKLKTVLLIRPASMMLVVVAIFYLWMLLRRTDSNPVHEEG
jgi:hypothetical protein